MRLPTDKRLNCDFYFPTPIWWSDTTYDNAELLKLFDYLKDSGVCGVITLSSILENLLRKMSANIETSDNSAYHLLRLLKAYGLATEPQLDIFER